MKSLLTPAGLRALHAHLSKPCLLAFDFDGVLAPIIAQRTRARPRARTTRRMEVLAKLAKVAVVSGRSKADVQSKLGFKPHFVVGNHGVEGLSEFRPRMQRAREQTALWSRQVRPELLLLPGGGADLENKGVSLCIHYRASRKPSEAADFLYRMASQLRPRPRLVSGKKVLNLVSQQAPNKGDAVRLLMAKSGLARAVYIGDDITDEDVFCLPPSRIFSVRVGKSSQSAAAYFVREQGDVERFLDALILALESYRTL